MNRELKKIVTISPVYPYRGGISQYGSLLVKELEKTYEVKCMSFSLMYPSVLYPGKSQKDYSSPCDIKSEISYRINTINPVSYVKTAAAINKIMPDLVIILWWHPYFVFTDIGILSLLNKNIKICICCNNVLPHDRIPFSRWLTKQVLKRGHMYLVHSEEEAILLKSMLNQNVCFKKIPCPNVSTFEKTGMDKEQARKKLKLQKDDKVLLFFGFVRKYKGLYHLFNIMPDIVKEDPKVKLLVVGDFYEKRERYFSLIQERKLQQNVFIYDKYIPDNEVEPYFAASDVVVLPYDSATASGVIQAAFFFGLPVIVTDVGGLSEVVVENKTGYVVPAFDEDALRRCVMSFFENYGSVDYNKYIEMENYKYSWSRIVNDIQDMWDEYQKK